MTIAIRQIHPVFVGEVSGIDITSPISPDEVAAIDAGMDQYAVLVFRDQKLTDEQQMAFTRQLGPLENARGGNITKPEDRRLTVGMNDVSNLGKDGRLLERDSRQRAFNIGDMLWHSDSSYRAIPASRRPSRASSPPTGGPRGTSSCGTTGAPCTASAAMTTASHAICGAPRSRATRPPSRRSKRGNVRRPWQVLQLLLASGAT